MNKSKIVIGSAILAGGLVLSAPFAASATEGDTSEVVTETYSWLLPDGGTADNVTWPQTLVGLGDIAAECGVTYQVDTYVGTREQIDAVVGDGVLANDGSPEDSGIVTNWHFNTGAICEVVVPPVEVPPVEVPPVVTPPVVEVPVEVPVVEDVAVVDETPQLAETGFDAGALPVVALGLIALGGVAFWTRRKLQRQG